MILITQDYIEVAAVNSTPPTVRITQQYIEVACRVESTPPRQSRLKLSFRKF